MKQTTELTPTMQKALAQMRAAGDKMNRYPGGFWKTDRVNPVSFGTPTMNALHARGLVVWSEHRKRAGEESSFPIQATIAP